MNKKNQAKPKTSSKKRTAKNNGATQQSANRFFPIVGVGASAGGLEAFTKLLESMPTNTGMAFVLVQHLAPNYESKLPEILSKTTAMPVSEVKDGMQVDPNCVYVIPPNTILAILNGVLHLMPRKEIHSQHMPIDYFFRSLAVDQKSKAIGVILSGTASDGVLGMKAIKAEGGLTFAQTEKTAKYFGMPQNAIAAGAVDFVLSPEEIAKELSRIGRHPYLVRSAATKTVELLPGSKDYLGKIYILLRNAVGVDFSYYKQNTLKRRIARRMILHRIENLESYVKYLQENTSEINDLYQDILINVTQFFRDPESYEVLKRKIFPAIMEAKVSESPIRIWVPGCSSGEEAYSIAICLIEVLEDASHNRQIQIFATDISEPSLEKARVGKYSDNIMLDVSQERLRRFFIKTEKGYQINKSIREMCVFAKQNVFKDPPFSKLDLISCRNVLIYLEPVLQKKIIPIFHYALNKTGFLMLGSSESIGGFSDLFSLIDKKCKIYLKKQTPSRLDIVFSPESIPTKKAEMVNRKTENSSFDVQKEADRIVLTEFAPTGVIINEDMDILQFRGRTGSYLEPAPGDANLNLLKMAREGLMLELRAAILEAKKKNIRVRKEGLRVKSNGRYIDVNLEVIPLGQQFAGGYYLVLFEEAEAPVVKLKENKLKESKGETGKRKQTVEEAQIAQLQQELSSAQTYLQTVVSELEDANSDLRTANEEILSSNEELQSTNEELETAKEELQATNEELTTVNEELHNRNFQLGRANDDMKNLLSSINMPMIMLGNDMRIRLFTSMAEKVFNLIPADAGRPFGDIKPNIDIPDLERLILDVISTVNTAERDVQDREGRWYSMRIRPYKSTENKLDGVVIVLVDINSTAKLGQISKRLTDAIMETVRESLLILGADLRISRANKVFYNTFKVAPEETENKFIYDLGNGQWNIPKLRALLEEILPKKGSVDNFEVTHDFPNIGQRKMLLNARQMLMDDQNLQLILLAIEDVSDRG